MFRFIPHIRYILFAILFLSTSLEGASVSEFKIVDLYREPFPENAFQRISEYFTGKENTGNRVIIRTQPKEYGGYYFILRLNKKVNVLPKGSSVKLELSLAQKVDNITYTFSLPQTNKAGFEIFVGITGEDWSYKNTDIIAWHIALLKQDGEVLAEKNSFLW